MRTFGDRRHSNYKSGANTYQRRKEYTTRTSNEWDLRIDVVGGLTADGVVARVKENLMSLTYAMVSGVESPDTNDFKGSSTHLGSEENHVHIGIISTLLLTRDQAVALVLPKNTDLPKGSIYAVPRNTKFPYVGWICHHSKEFTKVKGEPGLRYEHGVLPLDGFELPKLEAVDRMIRKN